METLHDNDFPADAGPVPGFYVAHHRWLDTEHGPGALYKVGHTGDLRRRLDDDAYVTCFPPGWRFVYTFETGSKRDAHRLETGVLDCSASRRVRRENGVLSELVHLSRAEVVVLATEVARRLNIEGTPRDLAASPHPYPAPPARAGEPRTANAPTPPSDGVLTPYEKGALRGLRVPEAQPPAHALDDIVADILDAVPSRPTVVGGGDAPPPKRKSAEDYLREAREAVQRERKCAVDAGIANGDTDDEDATFADAFDDILMDVAAQGGADDLQDLIASFDALNINAYAGQGPGARGVVLEDRAYQTEAIRASLEELRRPSGRAILQMACRCGKTKVAHGVIRDYLERPRGQGRARVLYLVPGLALLRQTAQKLDRYGFGGAVEILLVGSDDRPVPELTALRPCGSQDVAAGTTDPDLIRAVCERADGPPLLVVSTYQSSPLLPDSFDLAVFDESHRVCGDRRVRPFTHVLLNHENGHRLYMTATPRYDAPLSMKDRDRFGGVAYAYHMRQGIDAGYVNDFSLELVGREDDGETPAAVATASQIVAAVENLNASCGNAGKLLVFCRSIRHATELRRQVDELLATGRGHGVPVACLSAHSRMSRADIAASLAHFCSPGVPAVLFNCRLFQEGVEIPPLNGIFFASPRHSPRDIIQSLCRPLNIMPGKPASKVFIPVVVDPSAPPDSAKNLERFASIIPYFDALVAEDPLLYEHLLDPRGTQYPLRWVDSAVQASGGGRIRYDPDKLLSAARRSVRRGGNGKTERLLRAARIPWEIGFAELYRIVTECGRYPKTTDCFVYGDAKVNFGQFYRYARDSYTKWKEGRAQPLEPHQLYALEALPGWTPYGIEGPYPWRETLDFLEDWLQGHDGVPPMVEINKGGYVGLEATPMERLSGTLTCINQSDGRDRKSRDGAPRPGSGFTLDVAKQRDLDELCGRWGLRWRKERHPPPEGAAEGSVGSLVENDKGEYVGEKTFIQEAYGRFKTEWYGVGKESAYVQQWFPGYPLKHAHQEREDVWARRKEVVPPRWRGRGKTAKTEFDATKSVYM